MILGKVHIPIIGLVKIEYRFAIFTECIVEREGRIIARFTIDNFSEEKLQLNPLRLKACKNFKAIS